MKISEFEKLEAEMKGNNFATGYKLINTVFKVLSYFGNIASIFLAYFFMYTIIAIPFANMPILIFFISVLLLGGIELFKRNLFDKFSIQYLKQKTISGSVAPLLIFCLILISLSFYSSLNGAKQFSSKEKEITELSDNDIKIYSDSLTNIYDTRISDVDNEIKSYKDKLTAKDDEQYLINKALQENGYLNRSQRLRNTQLTEEKKYLDEQITKYTSSITGIKSERDSLIQNYTASIIADTDEKKEENESSSLIFVIISTLIEFIILGGVFFNEYYKLRSYREEKQKLDHDPTYQKWKVYNKILHTVYHEDMKMNQKLPNNKTMIHMCKINDMTVLPKEMTNFLKLITTLEIIKSTTSGRFINKPLDLSQEALNKYFKID